MKKNLKKLLALALIPFIFSSCKDDGNVQNNNLNENTQTELNNSNENENNASNNEGENVNTNEGENNTNNGENTGTNEGENNTNNGEDENNNNGEGENSNTENNNGNNEENNPPAEKEVEIGKVYRSNLWDDHVNKMAKKAVGDLYEKIPVFIATNYETRLDNYTAENDEKFLILTVNCFGTNASSAERLYREKMVEKGFTLSSLEPYGYLMKDYESDLFLDYQMVTDDTELYFQIKSYVRNTRQLEWDSYFVDLYADMHVPECPANAYNNLYNNLQNQVIIYAMFVEDNAMSNYQKILREAGYLYSSQSTTDCVVYDDPTGYVSVQVYETYGDYNTLALYITITNRWPTFSILAFTGLVNFPKLNSEDAIFDRYVFYEGATEADTVLVVYYDNLSNIDFGNYISYLVNDHGFVASNQRSGEGGSMFVDLTLETESYTVQLLLGFQYNAERNNSMYIAFYQCLNQGE